MIQGLNHFTVLTDDLERTLDFYVHTLGLKPGPRPDFGFPGVWLYVGDAALVHILSDRKLPVQRSGALDHVAFSARGLAAVVAQLESRKIDYELRRQPESNIWQLFCFDPNGAQVELDFDAAESR